MKSKAHIVILFLMLLVVSSNTSFACEKSSEKEKTEKASCAAKDNHSHKKSCCNNDSKENDGCGGTCSNPSCQCPTSVNTTVFLNVFPVEPQNNFKLLGNYWAFVQNKPKTVYLSIWQPPKIS